MAERLLNKTNSSSVPSLRFAAITLMPELFREYMSCGVIGNAFTTGKANLELINPRDFTTDKHRTVDDAPYGGGAGMVLKPEPMAAAIDQAQAKMPQATVYLLEPGGKLFDDAMARNLATSTDLIFLCGRYLGLDQRIIDTRVDVSLSVGDYVVSGGEIPAMIVMDAILRHVPGVLGNENSVVDESFTRGMLAPPCYTRPERFEGRNVPAELLCGDHAKIRSWRQERAQARTEHWHNERRKLHKLDTT